MGDLEIEALRTRAAEAEARLYSFRQAHAARGETLRKFIKERAPELWEQYAAISVNGSFYGDDYTLQPVFEREMNTLRWRVESAEQRAIKAADEIAALRDQLAVAKDLLRWSREAMLRGYTSTREKEEIRRIDEYFAALSRPNDGGERG